MISFATHPDRDELIKANLGLCHFVVARMSSNAYVRRMGRDESLAACQLELVNLAAEFDPMRGASFATYAVRILRRELHRTAKRWCEKSGSSLDTEFDVPESPLSLADTELLEILLGYLKPKRQQLVRRFYGIGTPAVAQPVLASELGISQQCVCARIQRGVQIMRKALERRAAG